MFRERFQTVCNFEKEFMAQSPIPASNVLLRTISHAVMGRRRFSHDREDSHPKGDPMTWAIHMAAKSGGVVPPCGGWRTGPRLQPQRPLCALDQRQRHPAAGQKTNGKHRQR